MVGYQNGKFITYYAAKIKINKERRSKAWIVSPQSKDHRS